MKDLETIVTSIRDDAVFNLEFSGLLLSDQVNDKSIREAKEFVHFLTERRLSKFDILRVLTLVSYDIATKILIEMKLMDEDQVKQV